MLWPHATAAVAILIGLILTPVGAANARPLDEVLQSKVLNVILYEDNEPFSWTDNGEIKGIDADIARAVAKKLGVEPNLILRMQGEQIEQDLRFNIVRGTFGGGIAGDVMFHVPVDREMIAAFKDAAIANPYFEQRVALALNPARVSQVTSFDAFRQHKIGVQIGTVSDYFLMRFAGGALVNSISHYIKPRQGVNEFKRGETTAILGVRSSLEALMRNQSVAAVWENPPMPGIVRGSWVLGTAVNERSRDLGHAVGSALTELAAQGDLKTITETYGVTYAAPTVQ